MEKPKKREYKSVLYGYRQFAYNADEMDAYLTDLLAPLKDVWSDYKDYYLKYSVHMTQAEVRMWCEISKLAERLNW